MPTPNDEKPDEPKAPVTEPTDRGRTGSRSALKRFHYRLPGGWLHLCVWDKVVQIEGFPVTVYDVTMQRSYKEKGRRQWTTFLREADLPVAAVALQEASFWLHDLRQGPPVQPSPTDGADSLPT